MNKQCPTTNYKTDYSNPLATGDVEFYKRPKLPTRSLKFDKKLMSHYEEMNNKMLAAKKGKRNNDLYQSLDGLKESK